MPALQEEKLSQQSPVGAALETAMNMPAGEKSKRLADKKERMRNSFIRQPPQASNAANPRVIAPQSVGDPAKGQLSMVSGHGAAQAAPGKAENLYTNVHGGTVGGRQDEDSGTVRMGATPQSSLAAASVPEPQMMANHGNTVRTDGPVMLSNTGAGQQRGVAMGDVNSFREGVQAIEKKRYALESAYPQQADGSYQVGNMDVAFQEGTDPEEAKRFLQDPVRPTAQIDRFNTRQQPLAMAPVQNTTPREGPELISYETNPNMDWRQAAAINTERTRGFNAEKTAGINALAGLERAEVTGQHGLAQVKQRGEGQLDTTAAIGKNRLGQIAATGAENRKTNKQKPAKAPKQQYIPHEYDNDGKLIPGTGTFVTAPPTRLSDNFNPDKAKISPEDSAYLQNLNDTGQYDILNQIEKQYGL